jgi:putative acetyltransferase
MILRPSGDGDLDAIRELLREYAAWLQVDLSFQGFEEELAGLPGEYAPPAGRLLVAESDGEICGLAGCVALRRIDAEICEMKRLYVAERFRGSGLGRRLAEAILEEARAIGYRRMRLDTLPQMGSAHRLYESMGFHEIEPYRFNPIAGTSFLERNV